MVVVGYQNAELLDIACVTTSLSMSNAIGSLDPPYHVNIATPRGRPIVCHPGLALQGEYALERLRGPLHTLIVSGGPGFAQAADDPEIVAHVRRLAMTSKRVASVCTGASILSAAGLLDGKRATTHWRFADEIAARNPKVTIDPDPIYIRDGNVITSAGVTSALDLALALIEEDHGAELARQVARDLVVYLQRPGNQAQMSLFTTAPPPANGLVRHVVDHITRNVDKDLSTAALAAEANVSERHLTRLFLEHLGLTPGRFVKQVRTEAAAKLLVTTSLPMPSVATRCGLGSAEALRQAFVSRYGIPPSQFRATQSRHEA